VWIELFAQRKADWFMLRSSGVIAFLLGAAPMGWAQQAVQVGTAGTFVPAGTLLHCTLDEPNFSSRTAQVGDPVLCHVNSVEMFGRPLIPRGAYLSARLEEYRDPGHFFGKGWIQLEFTSLTLPNGNFPLSAKVIAARPYRVDREGKILGRGHPKRDLVEWMIPILWPIKVLTLPARGPRPTLKDETRIDVRLMEDVLISESANSTSTGLTTRSSASSPGTDDRSASPATSRFGNVLSGNTSWPAHQLVSVPSPLIEIYQTTPATNQIQPSARHPLLTLLVLRGGRVYLAADYWVDDDNLDYTTGGGAPEAMPLEALDIIMTRRLNAKRGVPFILTAKHSASTE
jgi:hypothetical protein